MFILSLILCLGSYTKAQNLVPNGYFEIYDTCPDYPGQISRAVNWKVASLTPDYYNSCPNINSSNGINVPYTLVGYQQDCCGGGGYGGIYVFNKYFPNNGKEYISTKLNDTLKTGAKYIVSMLVNLCNIYDYGIASIGMNFTNSFIQAPASTGFINVPNPQIKNKTLLKDTLNWILVQDTIISIGNEVYLTVGNFSYDSLSDTVKVFDMPNQFYAYYYIDGVSVYEIDGSCNTYWDAGYDKYIIAGDSIRLGAINTDNSIYSWQNSVGGNTYLSSNTDARPWCKPAKTTTYYATKTCPNNNMFKDTVTVYVQQITGIEQWVVNSEQLSIYPNPASSSIQVSVNSKQALSISIYDLLGNEIINTKEKNVDIISLNEGIYFIEVRTVEGSYTQKIIVQH